VRGIFALQWTRFTGSASSSPDRLWCGSRRWVTARLLTLSGDKNVILLLINVLPRLLSL
jgi:hypothetical protein